MGRKSSTHDKLPEFNLKGKKLFQRRAVQALPLLVRQAKAEQSITYSDLADELGMENARNLNKVLGAVADGLEKLATQWKRTVPPLNFIVVNRATGIPGKGVAGLVEYPAAFRNGTLAYKKRIVDRILHGVFTFPDWDRVLEHYGLQPVTLSQPPVPPKPPGQNSVGQGGGESEDHKRLKEFVALHPEIVGLRGFARGTTEHAFPSEDTIDVFFDNGKRRVGVEVKGLRSDEMDIRRGMYQCVKYRALMEACLKTEQMRIPINVILVLGRDLPVALRAEKDTLGIECIGNVSVPQDFTA